jgi:hypothetical protein
VLPITAFDSKPADGSQLQARIVSLAADVQSRMKQLSATSTSAPRRSTTSSWN